MMQGKYTVAVTAAALLALAFPPVHARDITHVSDTLFVSGQPTVEAFNSFVSQHGGRHVIDLHPPSEDPDLNNAELLDREHGMTALQSDVEQLLRSTD